jgi:repressor LexA
MITQRQQQILDFLHSEHRRTGIMPSTREIQEHFGFASQTAAVSHLNALEKKGIITRLAGKARALMFADQEDREEIIDIPIYGMVPAGMGDDTEPVPEGMLSVDTRSMGVRPGSDVFALRVRGESMIGAHILDGDHVVLDKSKEPRNQDIVAALIDGETTLKRYVMDRRKPFLKAENTNYPDLIPARELLVQGVMVGLVRCGF